jgi:mevalonate kinase
MPEILKQAMEIERCFHGNPSGLDHSVIAMQKLVLFQQGAVLRSDLSVKDSLHFVIGVIGQHAPTAVNVQRLAQRRQRLEYTYQRCFEHIGSLVLEAVAALESGDAQALGALLDLNHGALNGLGVSSVDLERAVSCAREAGAIGAKLSGAGGGGAMIALCPKQGIDDVSQALTSMGCQTFSSTLHAN